MKRFALILAVALLALAPAITSANVIYTETFDPGVGNNDAGWSNGSGPSVVGWQSHVGVGAQDTSISSGGGDFDDWGISSSGTNGQAGTVGYAANTPGDDTANASISILWTEETLSRTGQEIETISFYLKNNDGDSPFHVAVEIGSNWYVSGTSYTQDDSNWTQQVFNWTTAASAWNGLNFIPGNETATPGGTLSIGSPLGSDLPSGDVTAFGLVLNGDEDSTVRVDTFEVTVPEPATMSLLALGGLGVLLKRKR